MGPTQPNRAAPSYQQRSPKPEDKQQKWTLLASPNGKDGSVRIHQNVEFWRSRLRQNRSEIFKLRPERHAGLQLIQGDLQIDDKILRGGDGAAISELPQLVFNSTEGADFLLFDLA